MAQKLPDRASGARARRRVRALIPFGRILFALALIGLGVEHFVLGDFVTGRAPAWPGWLPGRTGGAALSGAAIIAGAIAILTGRRARLAAILVAGMVLVWALLRHVPVVAGAPLLSPAWTAAGKALTFFGGALAVAGTRPPDHLLDRIPAGRFLNGTSGLLALGRLCLGTFLLITGIQHFMFTPFVASLIPAWFPGVPVFWTYFAGVALIAGGIGLLVPPTAWLAALLAGAMVFSWIWIVHLPRTLASVSDSIAIFEAPAVAGIAFVLAGARLLGTDPAGRDQLRSSRIT